MRLSTFVFGNKSAFGPSSCSQQTTIKPFSYAKTTSYKRQVRCYRESHCSGGYANPRFNVVALLVHSTSTLGIPYPASLLNHGDTPLL